MTPKIHLLTVAYRIDPYKKREESVTISFMWVPIFPSKFYTIEGGESMHGQPFKIYITQETHKILLYLGARETKSNGEVDDQIPPKILKVFLIEKGIPLKTELIVQFFQKNNDNVDIQILNDTVNVSVLDNEKKAGIPPELPAELPQIPVPHFEPISLFWMIDGTLSNTAFQKCVNTALLLTDNISQKAVIKAGYICFGEYQELLSSSQIPVNQNGFAILRGYLTGEISKFKADLRSLDAMPFFSHDDPAACIELAFRELADEIENQKGTAEGPVLVFVMGNSLPHYSVSELYQQKLHIIPTEEFENIRWKDELERLHKFKNIDIQPIWIEDQAAEMKWSELDLVGRKMGLNEARAWWNKSISESNKCFEITDDTTASAASSTLYDLIWQKYTPKMTILRPSIYPLWRSLDDLKVIVD